jgi:hypothetical protein
MVLSYLHIISYHKPYVPISNYLIWEFKHRLSLIPSHMPNLGCTKEQNFQIQQNFNCGLLGYHIMCFCVIGNTSEKPAASIFRVEKYQAATWISHRGTWEWQGQRMQDWSFGVRDHQQNTTALKGMRVNGKSWISEITSSTNVNMYIIQWFCNKFRG